MHSTTYFRQIQPERAVKVTLGQSENPRLLSILILWICKMRLFGKATKTLIIWKSSLSASSSLPAPARNAYEREFDTPVCHAKTLT